MLIQKSKEMMCRSFKKTFYRYQESPRPALNDNYGIYINIPFCQSFCAFCPFYKYPYSESVMEDYLDVLFRDIDNYDFEKDPNWVYMGGGTPNLLNIDQLSRLIAHLKKKVKLQQLGIELHPSLLDDDYLEALKNIGFTKISMGVESFSLEVQERSGRDNGAVGKIDTLLKKARELSLFVNIDIMVGLDGQDESIFLSDVARGALLKASQITLYPFMEINKKNAKPSLNEEKQFELIEKVADFLAGKSYTRKGPWTFCLEDDIYDSAKEELVNDYVGFGAASFSTIGEWKIVQPAIEAYLQKYRRNKHWVLSAQKDKSADQWRYFARMISDLELKYSSKFNFGINLYIFILKLSGYSHKGRLSKKGIFFAHHITKTVVESLPFPLQNPDKIINYDDYKKDLELKNQEFSSE